MKSISVVLSVAALALAVSGCNPDNQPAPDKTTNVQNATATPLAQTRDEFVAAAQKKLDQLDAEIKVLAGKSATYQDDAKVQADKALAGLRAQREALGRKYDDLKQAGQDTWDKSKAAFSNAWDDVEKAYADAKAKFQ